MKCNKNVLFIIPARGGSKRLPRKNVLPLNGKPLIYYSIDIARELTDDSNICVSTDDPEIVEAVEAYKLDVPFIRPEELASDTATSYDVIMHALEYYRERGIEYNTVILLQPTSPLRKATHIIDVIKMFDDSVDMIVSVKKSHSASVICHEDEELNLHLTLKKEAKKEQCLKEYYEYNGAIYLINVKSLYKNKNLRFNRIRKYVMDDYSSIDIDHQIDFEIASFLISHHV